jgi:hypothetical protein
VDYCILSKEGGYNYFLADQGGINEEDIIALYSHLVELEERSNRIKKYLHHFVTLFQCYRCVQETLQAATQASPDIIPIQPETKERKFTPIMSGATVNEGKNEILRVDLYPVGCHKKRRICR